MKSDIYQKIQLTVFGLLVAYGVANMAGVNVPLANLPAVNRVVDMLFILLAADQLRSKISQADSAPSAPPVDPAVQELLKFQAAVGKVAAAASTKQS